MFTINGTITADNMNDCVRKAIIIYVKANPSLTFNQLYDKFAQGKSSYIDNKVGKSRYHDLDICSSDGVKLYSYTQFRLKGSQKNWDRFVETCASLGIKIE